MSDQDVASSGIVGEDYCPGCRTDADPVMPGAVLTVRWCMEHEPSYSGPDDNAANTRRVLSGSGEAEGTDCRAVADIIERVEREKHR